MFAKGILVFCAQALLIKSTLGQCTSRAAFAAPGLSAPYAYDGIGASPFGFGGPGLAYDGIAFPGAELAGRGLTYDGLTSSWANRGLAYDGIYAPAMEFSPTSGGALPISSASAMAPIGISVTSENFYEGSLDVVGELPFVGAVSMEGVLPTAGAGAVNHACGNGMNVMISDTTGFGPAAYAPAAAIAPAAAMGLSAPFGFSAGISNIAYPAGWGGSIAPAAIATPGQAYLNGCAGNIGFAI